MQDWLNSVIFMDVDEDSITARLVPVAVKQDTFSRPNRMCVCVYVFFFNLDIQVNPKLPSPFINYQLKI
jgi:hypothetical protein